MEAGRNKRRSEGKIAFIPGKLLPISVRRYTIEDRVKKFPLLRQ